jgi:hypothetical protein
VRSGGLVLDPDCDHLVKRRFHLRLEVGLPLVDIGKFDKPNDAGIPGYRGTKTESLLN